MSTTTTVLALIKPAVGSDTDIWGPMFNSSMDIIDGLFTDPAKKMLKLANGGTGADTAAGARTNLGLGSLATLSTVLTANITDANVTTAKIADSNVTTAKIADGNVTAAKLASGVALASGTRALFHQTAAPVGWVKDTTINDKTLRVVSGSVSSGGSTPFSAIFASRSTNSHVVTGTVGSTVLDITQIPSHSHYVASPGGGTNGALSSGNYLDYNYFAPTSAYSYTLYGTTVGPDRGLSGATGSGAGHTHSFTADTHLHTLDMAVQYVDVIIAAKS